MADLPKTFEAKQIENKWYLFWQELQLFQVNPASDKPSFCLVMPPPNVTGSLHMGHALNMTLQDVLVRWKRMQGFESLWLPGTDHAGISTQTVVERHLIKTVGKKRVDFDRDEFLTHVWDWKEKNENTIIEQLKRIGCSCDWSKQRFTMDEGNNKAVRAAFKKLFDQGLIYRGDYLVNWDPVTMTAIADDEVEYEEKQSSLWFFKYPFADGSGFISIATTRPETMLGDTAVAVSPKDPRYASSIGKMIDLPLTGRQIPLIADIQVDPEFGTGAVKVTPAHDPVDYQMGLTHNLPFINIMTPDGKINEQGGAFAGLSMEEARQEVVKAMKEKGFLQKIEPHLNRVGVSYRSKAVVEPYLSKQWFVKMDGFKKKLKEIVQTDKVKIIPEHWVNTYYHWIENLRDWCISRQLWWGHRIPIWYHREDASRMICYDGEEVPEEVRKNPESWVQDGDVLDTWFSSALWPFSTLGWPEKTDLLKKFYPNSTLVTGHDILFFWVARMILMGDTMMGEPPFPKTFLHGLIYGKSYWRNTGGSIAYVTGEERLSYDLGKPIPKDVNSRFEKMSKTKGNVIDPLEIVDEYGTDAMRMALCSSATYAREIDLERRRFEEFRNFANKIWNGARFVFMHLDGNEAQGLSGLSAEEFSKGVDLKLLALEDRWILSLLMKTIKDINLKLENYTFDQAAMEAYDFFWKEFCSYYLEISKPVLFGKAGGPQERKNKQKLLTIILCQAVRLIHPMAPFITEELFQLLKEKFKDVKADDGQDPFTFEAIEALSKAACAVAPYPTVLDEKLIDPEIEETFSLIEKVVYTIRNIRGEMKLAPTVETEVHISGNKEDHNFKILNGYLPIISSLVKTSKIDMHPAEPNLGFVSTGMVEGLKVMIPLPHEWKEKEHKRLCKEKEKLSEAAAKTSLQLENPSFLEKAPSELVKNLKMQLERTHLDLKEIESKIKVLEEPSPL